MPIKIEDRQIQNPSLLHLLVPTESLRVQAKIKRASDLSVNNDFLQAHLVSSAHALTAVFLSFLNAPVYFGRGAQRFMFEAIHLQLDKGLIHLYHDTASSLQSLAFGTLGVFYVAGGVLFSQRVLHFIEPQPVVPTASLQGTPKPTPPSTSISSSSDHKKAKKRKKENRELLAQLGQAQTTAAKATRELRQSIQEKTLQLENLKEELKQKEAALQGREGLADQAQDVSQLTEQLTQLQEENRRADQALRTLRTDLEEKETELQTCAEKLQKKVEELASKERSLRDILEKNGRALEDKERELETLKTERISDLRQLQAEKQRIERELEGLQADVEKKELDFQKSREALVADTRDFLEKKERAFKDLETAKNHEFSQKENTLKELESEQREGARKFQEEHQRAQRELQNFEAELKKQEAELQMNRETLEKRAEKLTLEIRLFGDSKAAKEKEFGDKERELQDLQLEQTEKTRNFEETTKRKEEKLKTRKANLKQQATEVDKRREGLETRAEEQEAKARELADLEEKHTRALEKLNTLKTGLDTREVELRALGEELEKRTKAHEEQKVMFEAELANKAKEIAGRAQELETLNAERLKNFQESKDQIERELQTLKVGLDKREAELRTGGEELERKIKEHEAKARELTALEANNKQAQEEHTRIKEDLETLKADLKKKETGLQTGREELERKAKEQEEKNRELTANSEAERKRAQEELQTLKADLAKKEMELQTGREALEKSAQEQEEKICELTASEAEHKRLEQELQTLKADLVQKETEFRALEKRLEESAKEKTRLETKLSVTSFELTKKSQALRGREEELEKAEQQYSKQQELFKQSFTKQAENLEKTTQTVSQLQSELATTQRSLREHVQANAKQNSAQNFAKRRASKVDQELAIRYPNTKKNERLIATQQQQIETDKKQIAKLETELAQEKASLQNREKDLQTTNKELNTEKTRNRILRRCAHLKDLLHSIPLNELEPKRRDNLEQIKGFLQTIQNKLGKKVEETIFGILLGETDENLLPFECNLNDETKVEALLKLLKITVELADPKKIVGKGKEPEGTSDSGMAGVSQDTNLEDSLTGLQNAYIQVKKEREVKEGSSSGSLAKTVKTRRGRAAPKPPKPKTYLDDLNEWAGGPDRPYKVHRHRVLLNEYRKILEKQHTTNLKDAIKNVPHLVRANTKNTMYFASNRLLQTLTCPVDPLSLKSLGQIWTDYAVSYLYWSKSPTVYRDATTQYRAFLEALNDVIKTPEYQAIKNLPEGQIPNAMDKFCRNFVHLVCQVRWKETSVHSYLRGSRKAMDCAHRLEKGASSSSDLKLSAKNFAKILKDKSALIQGNDLSGAKDTPYVRWVSTFRNSSSGEIRKVADVSPGASLFTAAGELPPDYLEHLKALEAKNEGVLYCARQRHSEMYDKKLGALLDAQKNHPNLYVVVQPVDGDFFERKGPFKDMRTYKDLSEQLIARSLVFNKTRDRFVLPESLRNDATYTSEVLPQLMKQVCTFFFGGQENFESLKDWQSFILLFYELQKLDALFRLGKITEVTTSGQDFCSRGEVASIVARRVGDYMLGKQNDKKSLQETVDTILGACILAKNKGTPPLDLDPAFEVDKRLFELHPENKKTFEKYAIGGWKLEEIEVKKQEDQAAYPTPASARTPEEMAAFLNALPKSYRLQKGSFPLQEKKNAFVESPFNSTTFGENYVASQDPLVTFQLALEKEGGTKQQGENLFVNFFSPDILNRELQTELEKIFHHPHTSGTKLTREKSDLNIKVANKEILLSVYTAYTVNTTDPDKGTYRGNGNKTPYAIIEGETKITLPIGQPIEKASIEYGWWAPPLKVWKN